MLDMEDITPPTWGGQYTVDSYVFRETPTISNSCGFTGNHHFEFQGLEDDFDVPDAVLWMLVGEGKARDRVGMERSATVSWNDSCGGSDDTLEKHFHRRYEVTPVDGSGNFGESHLIKTRQGECGCRSAANSPFRWLLMIMCLLTRRRNS